MDQKLIRDGDTISEYQVDLRVTSSSTDRPRPPDLVGR